MVAVETKPAAMVVSLVFLIEYHISPAKEPHQVSMFRHHSTTPNTPLFSRTGLPHHTANRMAGQVGYSRHKAWSRLTTKWCNATHTQRIPGVASRATVDYFTSSRTFGGIVVTCSTRYRFTSLAALLGGVRLGQCGFILDLFRWLSLGLLH